MSGNDIFEANPERPPKELLERIRIGAISGFNNSTTVFAIPPFAALLVRLSADADKRATKIESLTNKLLWYTVALLVLTFLLVAKEGFDVYAQYSAPYQADQKADQNNHVKPKIHSLNK
jgi:hypothetical protein